MKLSDYYKEPDYIHYSNCHEDFCLLERFVPKGTETILSIASGLDNSLSFLVKDNVKVYAFDKNPSQVYLGELKIAAIKQFSHEEMLKFLGIENESKGDRDKQSDKQSKRDRVNLFNQLTLSPAAQLYFKNHLFLIEEGLIHCGRFEQYFHIFRQKVFPLVCGEKNICEFAQARTIEDQQLIYKNKINTIRFKLMFKIFFSKTLMSKLGRDKSFFKYSKDNLAKILKKRVDIGFNTILNKANPYYGYVLNNYYQELPFYLQKENFLRIKKNIHNITLDCKSFDEMLDKKYDFMNLSDIFEYMSEDSMEKYSDLISSHLNETGRVAFWNMMNVRKLTGMKKINDENDVMRDRAFFYRDFLVYEK